MTFGALAPSLIFLGDTEQFDRYRTSNLIISAMTPGPVEPNAEQLQNYLKVIVDDLLMLYQDGILISTPQFPNGTSDPIFHDFPSHHWVSGRRIRVALIGVICDHPAMCKMTGFADKKHTNAPCPKCNVTQADLFSDKANKNGAKLVACYSATWLIFNDRI